MHVISPPVTPPPASQFRRSAEELADPLLAWRRSDREFFAAGACHILAMQFSRTESDSGFKIIHVRPHGSAGHHFYAGNGNWAFDFNGWFRESELVQVNVDAARMTGDEWDYDLVTVRGNVLDYFSHHIHQLPDDFLGDVLARADAFIASETVQILRR
jgi:hypothetical protein